MNGASGSDSRQRSSRRRRSSDVQCRDVRARRPDAEFERGPPVLERVVLHRDRQRVLFDLIRLSLNEQLCQVPATRPRQRVLAGSSWIEASRGRPKRAEWASSLDEIPDAGRDDAARLGDAEHLAEALDGIGHEMHDQLGERPVEGVAPQWKQLGIGLVHLDPWMPLLQGLHERRRGVHGDDRVAAQPVDQFGRERARPAADIEHSLSRGDPGEVREHRRERDGVPAHEAVVGIGGDGESQDQKRIRPDTKHSREAARRPRHLRR